MAKDDIQIYFTKRVRCELPLEISFTIIQGVKMMEVEKDYLQVFKLEVLSEDLIAINHLQEQPEFRMTYYVEARDTHYNKELTGVKLYLVIENMHAVLMLAQEY